MQRRVAPSSAQRLMPLSGGMSADGRIELIKTVGIAAWILALSLCGIRAEAEAPLRDYTPLLAWIQHQDLQTPLQAFNEFQPGFDLKNHRANLQHFRRHPEIIEAIARKLKSRDLRWHLETIEKRLLFVPELRDEYADLYERYCRDLVDFVLEKTDLKNPFQAIRTPREPHPRIPDEGITVFLVHNLSRECVAIYSFVSPQNRTVQVTLNGKVPVGQVGAISSFLRIGDDGTIQFSRNAYTIWQNSAANPYTALGVPAEETLHAVLRRFTEQAIREALHDEQTADPTTAKRIVQHWVRIEEALVGGAVRILLNEFMARSFLNFSTAWFDADLVGKSDFDRYEYLERGIELVRDMGYATAIRMYAHSPTAFRAYLLRH
jgi:hypothetical protein